MEIKTLLKNTSYLAGTRMIKFIAGIFRSKLNAIYLGTDGVGIVSQLVMVVHMSNNFTTLGMNEAVVKQIASNSQNESKEKIASSIKTYLMTIIFFLVTSMILLFFFREDVTRYLFGNDELMIYFYVALFTFPILIINGVFFAILKGFKAIKHIASSRVGIILTNLILFVPLVMLYKLNGAVAFIPISFLITLAWNFYFAKKYYMEPYELSVKNIITAPVVTEFRREMLVFSGYGLVVSTLSIISTFAGRSIVVTNLGIDKIGVYTPIITWAGLFTGFLLPAFHTYLFTRFTELKSDKEAGGLINDALRLATFCLLPLLFIAIPFRNLLIQAFYSKEFLEASIYLPFHFLGVVFNVWFVVFGQSLTPRGYIKQHALFQSMFHVLSLTLAIILVPKYDLYGWMLKFIISYVFLFALNFVFLNVKINFKLELKNLSIMLFLLLGSGLLILVDFLYQPVWGRILGPTLLIMSYFLLSDKEKEFLLKKIKLKKS